MIRFKTFILAVACMMFGGLLFSQVPQTISYQAVVRAGNNMLIRQKTISLKASILQGSATGTSVYVETHRPTTNDNGVVFLEIGGGQSNQTFSDIDWSRGPYFLMTQIDPEGGSNYSITAVNQMLCVPYALYAVTAGNASGTSGSVDVTLSGVLNNGNDAGNKQIKNVANPTESQDVVTLSYLQNVVDQLNATVLSMIEQSGFIDSRDGNLYRVIHVGTQYWLAENLRYLPNVNPASEGSEDSGQTNLSKYYVYGYDGNDVAAAKSEAAYETYGVLYNWNAAMNRSSSSSSNPSGVQGVCPDGWHLPSDAEWTALEIYLQNNGYNADGTTDTDSDRTTNNVTAKALASQEGWTTSTTANAVGNTPSLNNGSHFAGKPAGIRASDAFSGQSENTYWWSATEQSSTAAFYRSLTYSSSETQRLNTDKSNGYSVRCVKNQ